MFENMAPFPYRQGDLSRRSFPGSWFVGVRKSELARFRVVPCIPDEAVGGTLPVKYYTPIYHRVFHSVPSRNHCILYGLGSSGLRAA